MGLYTIVTRASGTTLTADIFNSDHVNHVTHTEPMSINSHEPNVVTMDKETNPITVAGEVSLPASTADELQRIRFVLTQLKTLLNAGTPPAHWYVPLGTAAFMAFPAVACRRELTSAQGIPNNVSTRLLFDVTLYDTVGSMAAGSGLRAPLTGFYAVGATCGLGDGMSAGPSGDFTLTISKSSVVTGPTVVTPIATNECFTHLDIAPQILTVNAVAAFSAGDYLQTYVRHTSGTTITPLVVTDAHPAMWMALVSA